MRCQVLLLKAAALSLSFIVTAALPSVANAAPPHCMAHIIADVAAEEAPEQVKSKSNGEFGPITLIKVNKKSGRMTVKVAAALRRQRSLAAHPSPRGVGGAQHSAREEAVNDMKMRSP